MRLPSKPYSSLPIYSIGSTNTLPRDRINAMATVKGLSVAAGPGPLMTEGEASVPPTLKESTKAASKGGGKATGAAASPKADKSSGSPQRHSIHKTMSK